MVLDGHCFVLEDENVGVLFLHDLELVPEHLELILLLLILTHDDIQLLLRCSVMFLQYCDILRYILLLLRLLLEAMAIQHHVTQLEAKNKEEFQYR